MPATLQHAFISASPSQAHMREAARGALAMHAEVNSWRPWLVQARALLTPKEVARIERLRRDEDRDTRVAAYALHRLMLGALLDCTPQAVPLIRDARGCPRLEGRDTPLHTSLCHADTRIAVAAAWSGPIGVDLEPATRAAAMPEIADAVLHRDERAVTRAEDGRALLELWVGKEAVLKAAGIGLELAMSAFPVPESRVMPLPGHPGQQVRVVPIEIAGFAGAIACAPDAEPLVLDLRLPPPRQ